MEQLRKPFVKSKDVLWEKLYSKLDGEYRFPPKEEIIDYESAEKAWNEGIPLESPSMFLRCNAKTGNYIYHLALVPLIMRTVVASYPWIFCSYVILCQIRDFL